MSETTVSHPSRTELESFFHGTLEESRRQVIEDHIAKCDSCCDVLRTIPHDPLVERIHAATSSVDDGTTPFSSPSSTDIADETGTIPAALLDHPRYRIVRMLGQGGMGVVYQAEHKLMERPVALKVITSRLVSSDLAVERFRQEVRAAAKLSHRNIVTAFDAEQAGDMHFLVMEYIDGISLSGLVSRRKQLPVLHACNYVMQAAQGLQHAFQKGMVHRDIKPHNLMRTKRGTIKILDFGLARFATEADGASDDPGLTADFTALGTPDYMAPEQARDSKRADIRADLYSLGCTLYYLLVGQPPFPGGSSFEKVLGHCERQPKPISELRIDIPAEVIAIVDRLMAKNPDDRFQTPAGLVEALKPHGRPDSTYTADTQPSAANTVLAMPSIERQAPPKLTVQKEKASAKARSHRLDDLRPSWIRENRWLVGGLAALGGAIAAWFVLGKLGGNDSPPIPPVIPEQENIAENGLVTPPHSATQQQGMVDLIPHVDLDGDVVAGQWERTDDGQLHVDAAEDARIMINYTPPREYDFEVMFTRHSGDQSIALHFVDGDGEATFDVDGWLENLAGIQNIDGQDARANPTRTDNVSLVNGQTYTISLRVRRDRVEAFLDGKLLTTYLGDGSDLSYLGLWALPRPSLGLGAYDSETTFHSVRLRPISN